MLIMALVATVMPSCRFLDELPTSNLVGEQVYGSMEASQSALEGCYQSLLGLYGSAFLNQIQGSSVLQHNQSNQGAAGAPF